MKSVTVIDYGAGNLRSVHRRLVSVGATVRVSSDPQEVAQAEKIVLPGVGHFGAAMENLRRSGMVEGLHEAVLQRGVPILGICLGMQLMASCSSEGNARGLGWFSGSVVRFDVPDHLRYKVPHMGWNQVRRSKDSPLLQGIPDFSEFYFVHSYHYLSGEGSETLLTSDYAYPFACAVARDNILGVQFHPEKSHEAGITMLRNFMRL